MPWTLCMSKDVVRAACVDERPACLFKKFNEFSAFHGVYYTHEDKLFGDTQIFSSKGEGSLLFHAAPLPHDRYPLSFIS